MKFVGILVAATAVLAVSAGPCLAQSGDAKKGREIFAQKGCWGCHGYDGQGGVTGPKIGPEPMALESLIAFLRNADKTRMPPYDANGLPDTEVGHIHAYLTSLPKPADWKTIPLLKQ